MSAISPWAWVGFITFVLIFISLDLGFFHRESREVRFREAFGWMIVWLAAAVLFDLGLIFWLGSKSATEFTAGCLIEFSLSIDNIFVIALLFSYFRTPPPEQHRVLFWGILGALVMRGLLIGVGAVLIRRFEWMFYVLGGFLVLTGAKMLIVRSGSVNPEKNPILRLARRVYPVSSGLEGRAFFTRLNGRRALTPLALVLLLVECSDLVFALDSVPAIFGVTTNPFIIFTSNVFAILMLRSLYFVLARAIGYFRFLKFGLATVLIFIGARMLVRNQFDIPINVSLIVVGGILAISMVISLVKPGDK